MLSGSSLCLLTGTSSGNSTYSSTARHLFTSRYCSSGKPSTASGQSNTRTSSVLSDPQATRAVPDGSLARPAKKKARLSDEPAPAAGIPEGETRSSPEKTRVSWGSANTCDGRDEGGGGG